MRFEESKASVSRAWARRNESDSSSTKAVSSSSAPTSKDFSSRCSSTLLLIEEWGFTPDQASLYASTVLCRNAEGSADWVRTNALHLSGSWVRGEQRGNVGSWLSTMKETWTFNIDLTYEHKIERYDSSITTRPFFQSSYAGPTASVHSGIWAPPDWIRDQLDLFLMSANGFARQMKLEWLDNSNCDYRACSIDGQRFGRE